MGLLLVHKISLYVTLSTMTREILSNNLKTEIPSYIHHISDFFEAARTNGFDLQKMNEWWHEEDDGKSPRLITFMFERNHT
ncbi:MAG: hypothetical protein ACE5D7_06840 [Fidelibacterota bacterium]